jgi:hypothetical protein
MSGPTHGCWAWPPLMALWLSQAGAAPVDMVAKADNPDAARLPTLGVWQDGKLTLVASTFPNVPDFTCDSWCYESDVEFLSARGLDGGRLELRHRWQQNPEVLFVTTVTPEAGAVEFAARAELAEGAKGELPESVPCLNLCWQLRRAPGFASAPDPFPDWVKRCFIFTEKGLTFLDQTTRRKIPCRAPDDRYNNPPWVQMYVGTWQDIPQVTPTSWADYSPDRYTTTAIGCVSRDRKWLAAIANDSAPLMAQAWHDCMHNNPLWLPAEAPLKDRVWRLKVYAMANDPERLLERVTADFPKARQAAPQ